MRRCVEIFLIPLTSPLLLGVYENGKLIERMSSTQKSSEILPQLFEKLLQKYDIKALFYVNGPGSFMAIKVAYVFLKTLSIVQKIPLFGCDGFHFNNNAPIKAIGKLYFVNIAQNIKTQKFDTVQESKFVLPKTLPYDAFKKDAAPLYKIGAV